MGDVIVDKALHERLVRHRLPALDDAQAARLLAQGPVDGSPRPHLAGYWACHTVFYNQQLAKAHAPSAGRGRVVGLAHESPFAFLPYEATCVGTATVSFLHHAIADMVVGHIQVAEL